MTAASTSRTSTAAAVVAIALACVGVAHGLTRDDWMVKDITTPVTLNPGTDAHTGVPTLTLTNGLVSRTFATIGTAPQQTLATIGYDSMADPWALSAERSAMLRAVKPEAFVTLDKNFSYAVGGAAMEPARAGDNCTAAYFNRTACAFAVPPPGPVPSGAAGTWLYAGHATSAPSAPFPWVPGTRGSPGPDLVSWPPQGLHLTINFTAPSGVPASHAALTVGVHYELYVGIPLMSKWISVASTAGGGSGPDVQVSRVVVEYLATNFPYAPTSAGGPFVGPVGAGSALSSFLTAMTDQAHGAQAAWVADPDVGASPGAAEPVLNCSYTTGPGVRLGVLPERSLGASGEFVSFRCFELVTDTLDPERASLGVRRIYRTLAPHTMENPIFFHLTDASPAGFRSAVDQMAEVGFEMLIFSFGSGFNLESSDPTYLAQIAADVKYAHAKGIEVGGYDLICLDRGHGGYGGNVGDQWDRVLPDGTLGADACFASGWYDKLNDYILNFINVTGLSNLETDGPYGGGTCAATNHSHHENEEDSVYMQTQYQAHLYATLRGIGNGVYINQPDNFFFQGGSKTAMGYDENQFSLPRWQDLSVSRAGFYMDTYQHTPSIGWGFMPLVPYHSGAPGVAFEPLSTNIDAYEFGLAQYLSMGIAACYRGTRLYDTPTVQAMVAKWVGFYKQHRAILTSDIIHVKRADMQGLDCILHANSRLNESGIAIVYNPTSEAVSTTLFLPVYYTGIQTTALVSHEDAAPTRVAVTRDYFVSVPVSVPAKGITYFVFTNGDSDEEQVRAIGHVVHRSH